MQHDKALHIIAGTVAGTIGYIAAHFLSHDPWIGALVAGVIAGAVKEVWDSTGKGTVDHMDAVATVAGALPLVLVGAL